MKIFLFTFLSCLLFSLSSRAAVSLVTRENYRQQTDSPWITDILNGQGHMDDFEDNQFNLPNTTGGTEVIISTRIPEGSPGFGVDGDDGVIDGLSGVGTRFLSSTNALSMQGQRPGTLNVRFSLDNQGRLPKRVGFALLAVGNAPRILTAYDQNGAEIYRQGVIVPSSLVAPVDATRVFFVGLESDVGIASFHFIGAGFDHFQFSYIPEPGVFSLLGLAALVIYRRRRRPIATPA